MLNGVTLRAQIASIIDVLAKAAVAEIAKVVEDGMVVLRLEMCQRENEINKLKSNIEVLHSELRAAQERVIQRADNRGRDDAQRDVGSEMNVVENVQSEKQHSSLPLPEVKVKREPVEERSEARGQPEHPPLYEGDGTQWRPMLQPQPGRSNSEYLNAGQSSMSYLESTLSSALAEPCSSSAGFQPSPYNRGLLGYNQYRTSYNTMRRRTNKRLLFKKGYHCPYCGKYFERSGHLERHIRIHTGEKPYRCEICGRRFNQKCSLKEHTKIHRRGLQQLPAQVQINQEKQLPEPVNQIPDAPHPEKESPKTSEDVQQKTEDAVKTPVQVKSEPAEETVTQPEIKEGNQQTAESVESIGDKSTTSKRDEQPWTSTPQEQNSSEISRTEYHGSSAQTPITGMNQILSPSAEASCSTFSFPGKPFEEPKGSMMPQTAYGPADSLMVPGEAGLPGMVGPTPNQHMQDGAMSFKMIKPKKCFLCSYCGKIFVRSGHLERHLRIHTGEKPYGCHICGRFFNQKSSLKGHMKTHRNGESTDMVEGHSLMFTLPENHLLKDRAEPRNRPPAPDEQIPSSTFTNAAGEHAVMVKLEQRGGGFQALGQTGSGNGTGNHERSQLWTSGMETRGDADDPNVCLLLPDVKYHVGSVPGAAGELQEYTSQMKDVTFYENKKDNLMHGAPYSIMGMPSRNSDLTLAPELQNQHIIEAVTVNDYSAVSDGNHEGGVFEYEMMATGSNEDSCGGDASMQNCFICSACGQSFDSFSLYQTHQCQLITEPTFGCHICGKTFNQMSILKLHLKLHSE